MDVGVVLVGLAVLGLLAGMIGLGGLEAARGRDLAWRRIAGERRRIREERQRLQVMQETIERCRDCPYRGAADDPFA
jgi:hypothetical protein